MQTRNHKALALKLVVETNNDGLWRHRRHFCSAASNRTITC